jgi:hypothetical protein
MLTACNWEISAVLLREDPLFGDAGLAQHLALRQDLTLAQIRARPGGARAY